MLEIGLDRGQPIREHADVLELVDDRACLRRAGARAPAIALAEAEAGVEDQRDRVPERAGAARLRLQRAVHVLASFGELSEARSVSARVP